jgi:hypothetical protein
MQGADVVRRRLVGEDVHVAVGSLGISEAHGSRLGAAAKQLLAQQRRQFVRASHGENVLARFGRLDLLQQLPKRRSGHRKADHQRRRE